ASAIAGSAQWLPGLKEFQIILQDSCDLCVVLRRRDFDSMLGRFNRLGEPPQLGVGGGEDMKKRRVRCVGALAEGLRNRESFGAISQGRIRSRRKRKCQTRSS